MRPRALLGGFFLSALVVSLAGCSSGAKGPKKVTVTGTILQNGKPYQVPQGMVVEFNFIADSEKDTGSSYPAFYDVEKLEYQAKDIPVGKYKVVFQVLEGYGTQKPKDLMKDRFTADKTPLKYEISDSNTRIDIDLGKN